MLGKTPLQQLIPQRLTELRKRLYGNIWQRTDHVVKISMTRPRQDYQNYEQARKEKLAAVKSFPRVWGPKWAQAWFRIEVPKAALKEGLYLYWDDEGESTLYADGLPWYGIDAAHHHAPLPGKASELWIEGTCCRTGIWFYDGKQLSEEGSTLRGAGIWRRDETAWQVYWDFCVLLDLMEFEYRRFLTSENDWNRGNGYHQPIFRISALFRRIMRGLDDFADAFDHDGYTAATMLKRIYRDLSATSASLKGILTGHAHIDLVWLWPERIGESKAVHTFATANRLIEQYPEFRFGYSQPASYDAVARRSPKLIKEVREKIRSGKWEATGGSDVESDTQLPCGEALARAFVIGQERFRDLRDGDPSRVLWLPDVFGYSPCLPQILRQTGVSWFFTTKLTWGTVNRFPYSSFRWRGHDGSEVVVHVSQEGDYNGQVHFEGIKKMEQCQQEAGLHNEFLVPTGLGDGGGGATPEILERARRVRDLCGMPRCEWGRIEDFFERLEELRGELPVWQGELYLEYHRGVQTTHGDLKAAFRAAERGLQAWEAANAVTRRGPIDTNAWRRVIFAQFHDAIPGSSIREVYEEMVPELESIARTGEKAAAGAFGKGRRNRHFNPLALPQTIEENGRLVELSPLSTASIRSGRRPDDCVRAGPGILRNRRLKARFNAAGEITSLEVDGRSLRFPEPANQMWIYPDHPHMYPAWDIDRPALGNGRRVKGRARVAVEQTNPSRAELAFARPLTDKSSLVTRYVLEAESPVLKIEWEIDWQDTEMLLKSVFPTEYNGKMARFGAPFGSTLRPQHPGDPRAEAMYEVPGSRWAVLSDDGEQEGISLVTEAKYGFTAQSGVLGLSLLKSALIHSANTHLSIRTLRNGNPYSDIGKWVIRGAVSLFHRDLARELQPAALAERLYREPVRIAGSEPVSSPFLGLEGGESLIPVWVQPHADGGCVVRLNETLGRRGACRVRLADGAVAEIVDLMGEPMKDVRYRGGLLEFRPYALLGLRIRP
ncbi:MAG: alpha-mannosidase [Oceanipulchritudo sp.]